MAVFTLDLSEGLREKLEVHRKRMGARSLADAVRLLIDPVPGVDLPVVEEVGAWVVSVDLTTPRIINEKFPGPKRVMEPLTTETRVVEDRLPVGHKERVMGRDPRSAAAVCVGWNVLTGYTEDGTPIRKFEARKA